MMYRTCKITQKITNILEHKAEGDLNGDCYKWAISRSSLLCYRNHPTCIEWRDTLSGKRTANSRSRWIPLVLPVSKTSISCAANNHPPTNTVRVLEHLWNKSPGGSTPGKLFSTPIDCRQSSLNLPSQRE